MLRMTLSLLVLPACAALVVGCGDGGDAPIAKTRAVAFANAVNLRGGDVPGMATLVSGFETKNGPPFGSCAAHIGASDQVAAVESTWFVRSSGQRPGRVVGAVEQPPVEGVHSVVYVMHGPDL